MINKEDRRKLYRQCYDRWGAISQILMFIEESSELTIELTKGLRENKRYDRGKTIDELADVTIMLEQMQMIIGASDQELEEAVQRKLLRLIKYLNETTEKEE